MAHLGNTAVLDAFFHQFEHICSFSSVDVMFNQLEIPCVSWNDSGGPYALYSYLRAAGAFVISLTRDPFDTFVSVKHLALAGGRAHRRDGQALSQLNAAVSLDEAEFRQYRDQLLWHRRTLEEDMAGYGQFFQLQYSELVNGVMPDRLTSAITDAAAKRGIRIDPTRIQVHKAALERSGIDYTTAFANYYELRAQYGIEAATAHAQLSDAEGAAGD